MVKAGNRNGKRHREGGTAVEHADGRKAGTRQGTELTASEFAAIREKELLKENFGLAKARLGRGEPKSRTLLHIATDWPGNFPNGAQAVAALVEHGADVNARSIGKHTETPLHWAASCDDVAVLDALLDHGADIEANGACIGGGTPLADAVAFGQWKAARRLIERGALANLWQAAGLGLMERLKITLRRL